MQGIIRDGDGKALKLQLNAQERLGGSTCDVVRSSEVEDFTMSSLNRPKQPPNIH